MNADDKHQLRKEEENDAAASRVTERTMGKIELDKIVKDRADWLVDAVACATQDRRFLRGEPECDEVATDAIQMSGAKAIETAIRAYLAATTSEAIEADWIIQEYKVWKGLHPTEPRWHDAGYVSASWNDLNDILEYIQHNKPEALLRIVRRPAALASQATRETA